MADLPDIHFGTVGETTDWRGSDYDPGLDDDELLPETPKSVIKLLGFDPLEMEQQEDGQVS